MRIIKEGKLTESRDLARDSSIPWVRKPGYNVRELMARPLKNFQRVLTI